PRDETNAQTPNVAALADLTTLADTSDTPPANGDPADALAEALIATGALDAHIERIVRRILAEYDAQQNVYARRAGGYRPGAFGSIG
ncbi:MAG: hypothetical protein ACXWQ5_24290, partial [Ktedonobacterales bacterium]